MEPVQSLSQEEDTLVIIHAGKQKPASPGAQQFTCGTLANVTSVTIALGTWKPEVEEWEVQNCFLGLHLFISCVEVEECSVRLLHFYGISIFKLDFYYRIVLDSVEIPFWRFFLKEERIKSTSFKKKNLTLT